ncbi:MAG: sigma 54-interacting transcriptional regulator [Lentisphaerae bacterium]|nr:sigma 54-interacting transcriptional regulator [Lentisphaerota bacterium]
MAEGFALARKLHDVTFMSAGIEASTVHSKAVKVMAEVGIDISAQKSKSLKNIDPCLFDIVVTLCEHAAESCPILPGHPAMVKWSLPDPAAVKGSEAEIIASFRASRDVIHRLVDDMIDHGYIAALSQAKCCADMVLDNISDGVIAHDMKRHIFYFNKSAEEITGYASSEVVNRDCHEAFPGNFCGGNCRFCNGQIPEEDEYAQEQQIITKSGEQRIVHMRIRKMKEADGHAVGVLASFRDITTEKRLARRLGEINQFSGIIGRDFRMLEIFDLIRDLADSNAPVLIQGESGTGKELVASAIHNEGQRANKLFVPVNCGALPEALLESELFGHVKGAFTGAIRDKKGRFELADGGTIFLDEIGDISPAMQVRLMRVLQEGRFERVGSEKTISVDVRVISATNKNLSDEIKSGHFREDLYYRLSVVPLTLPPLRERRNDIPLLVDHILAQIKKETNRKELTLAADTLELMMSYSWPGNIRELQNWLQFAFIKCKGKVILPEHLPPPRSGPDERVLTSGRQRKRRKLNMSSVQTTLAQTHGNKLEAAKILNVSRATLYRFLDETGMQ